MSTLPRSSQPALASLLQASTGQGSEATAIAPRAQAKALLQAEHAMTEEQAHRWLQKTAMDWKLPLADVCQAVIAGTMRPGMTAREGGPRFAAAARMLRTEITTGTRRPGSRVTIAEVQAMHGISRNCARKAIRELAGDGLLLSGPRRPGGYYVAGEPAAADGTAPRRYPALGTGADHKESQERNMMTVATPMTRMSSPHPARSGTAETDLFPAGGPS